MFCDYNFYFIKTFQFIYLKSFIILCKSKKVKQNRVQKEKKIERVQKLVKNRNETNTIKFCLFK